VLLAQPAQLPLWSSQLDAPVAAHRAKLIGQQEELARALGQSVNSAYRDEIARANFMALRVQAIWEEPQRAFSWTAAYWFLVLLPTLAGRFVALSALREYERIRWQTARAVIEAEGKRAEQRVQQELLAFPSYRPRAHRSLSSPFDARTHFLARLHPAPPAPAPVPKKLWRFRRAP
jgi:hypothetical protein